MGNKVLFKLSEAAVWCGGTLCGEDRDVCCVAIDSRNITSGQKTMFVALKGENTDGHKYIDKAIENGAECILCERNPAGKSCLVVADTLKALGDIAKGVKEKIKTLELTLAVTGSVGKTTTKEFMASVFKTTYKTHKTEGNFNSVIGLPLTVFDMECDTQAAVFEMGMSSFGEIEAMVDIARPDGAIITNIGTAHMEMLGSRENILKAKLEMTKYFDKDSVLVLNGDDPYLWRESGKTVEYKRIYSAIFNEEADFIAKNVTFSPNGLSYDIYIKAEGRMVEGIKIPAIGMHNVYNSAAVFALAYTFGVTEENIRHGLLNYTTTGMRQKIYDVDKYTVIADCYNSSPESARASCTTISGLARERGVRSHAVLGEMRELGAASAALHREVGECAYNNGVDFLYLWGTNAMRIADGALEAGMPSERVFSFPDSCSYDELSAKIRDNLNDGDIIMFKASRAVKLEEAIENFKGTFKV